MKKRVLFILSSMFISLIGFSATITVVNSGTTFSPATITITFGDSVLFSLSAQHNAREVSQTTWNANGNTALAGGFQTSFGGSLVLPAQLTVGTHYYVCAPHAAAGMKGMIIVQAAAGIVENTPKLNFSLSPNPAGDLVTVKSDKKATDLHYVVIDQIGRTVIEGDLIGESTNIDISELTQGLYVFQVGTHRKQYIRFVKK